MRTSAPVNPRQGRLQARDAAGCPGVEPISRVKVSGRPAKKKKRDAVACRSRPGRDGGLPFYISRLRRACVCDMGYVRYSVLYVHTHVHTYIRIYIHLHGYPKDTQSFPVSRKCNAVQCSSGGGGGGGGGTLQTEMPPTANPLLELHICSIPDELGKHRSNLVPGNTQRDSPLGRPGGAGSSNERAAAPRGPLEMG